MHLTRPKPDALQELFLRDMVLQAANNQDRLNRTLADDWAHKPWHYGKAVARETMEILDHTKWEWWKHKDAGAMWTGEQRRAIHMELCDILHFGLSSIIKSKTDPAYLVTAFEAAHANNGSHESWRTMELHMGVLAFDGLVYDRFCVDAFARLCLAAGLDLDVLLVYYFAKTALNEFRWANGYKEKTYVKLWSFPEQEEKREDNDYLCDFLEDAIDSVGALEMLQSVTSGGFSDNVHHHLRVLYANIVR